GRLGADAAELPGRLMADLADGRRGRRPRLDEASVPGARVVALQAWTTWNAPMPPPQEQAEPYVNRPGLLAAAEERILTEALAGV
ncbi:hypothetical protein ACFPZI_30200, partial [Streptomyces chlorus]